MAMKGMSGKLKSGGKYGQDTAKGSGGGGNTPMIGKYSNTKATRLPAGGGVRKSMKGY